MQRSFSCLRLCPRFPFRATYAPWSRRVGVTRPACGYGAGEGRSLPGASLPGPGVPLLAVVRARLRLRWSGAVWPCVPPFLASRCLQLAVRGNGARFGGKADRYGRFLARLTAVALKRRDSGRTKMFDQGFCWRLAGFSRFGPLMWCHNGHSCQKATTAVGRAMSPTGGQPVRAKVPMAIV